MNAKEFLESTLRPTLMDMDMFSRSAEKLFADDGMSRKRRIPV